jgi:hypothetical protein
VGYLKSNPPPSSFMGLIVREPLGLDVLVLGGRHRMQERALGRRDWKGSLPLQVAHLLAPLWSPFFSWQYWGLNSGFCTCSSHTVSSQVDSYLSTSASIIDMCCPHRWLAV